MKSRNVYFKLNSKIIFLLFLLLFILWSEFISAQMTFVHPGGVNGKTELDYVKAQIAAGAQPWANDFLQLQAVATNYNGTVAPQDGNENGQKADARQCYANALAWYYTGNVTYAQNAIRILNVWGTTFNGYATTGQSLLVAGWIGALLGPAAEIMSGYSGWQPADKANVQNMFKTKFYPALNTMSTWNGNVDLTQIDAMINIAVFCEDETEFNLAISRLNARNPSYFYLASDGGVPPINGDGGNVNTFWSNPTSWVDGLTQETCRDNNHHAQFALASALHAAEVAWNQGVDLYTPNQARYTAALELMARQVQTGSMQGTCGNNTTTTDLYDTWQIGYNHYHNRKGINMPNTLTVITNKIIPNGQSDWNIFFETLTHNMTGFVAGPPIVCKQPNLGSDISTCVATLPTTLNANTGAPGGAISYRWYTWDGTTKTLIVGQTGQSLLATALGGYIVERDSAYSGGTCTHSDEILISNTFPVPSFSGPLTLCATTNYTLTPLNLASFPGSTTWQWAVDYSGGTSFNTLTGETSSSLSFVRRAGNYRLTASAGACTNANKLSVSSLLPIPVDGCAGVGPANVPISITNATGTNYNWYDAPTGGNLLASGTGVLATSSPSISATTTYYVQDMNSINANVGPYFPSTPTTYTNGGNVGADNQVQARFEAIGNYTITSIYIPYMLWSAGEAAKRATFEITNDAGTVITTTAQYTGALAGGTFGAFPSVYIIRFNVSIPITGGTLANPTVLRIRFQNNGTNDGNPYLFNNNVDPFDGAMPLNWNYVDNAGGSTMRLIGSSIYGTNTTARYSFFTGFTLSAGASCGRIPVLAKIGGCLAAPIELINFEAIKLPTETTLKWVTASELNNDYFSIEKSMDGINFSPIGKVNGMGTKNSSSEYYFSDESIQDGIAYYRLVQVDLDGKSTISTIVTIQRSSTVSVQIAPNPFTEATKVSVESIEDETFTLVVLELSGRILLEQIFVKTIELELGNQFEPGMYLIQLKSSTKIITRRILKQ